MCERRSVQKTERRGVQQKERMSVQQKGGMANALALAVTTLTPTHLWAVEMDTAVDTLLHAWGGGVVQRTIVGRAE